MKEFALHILDIAENCLRAEAKTIFIGIESEKASGVLRLEITDDGRGMDEEEIRKVNDPFYTSRTVRNVGMGIPLLKQHAEMTGGELEIYSKKGVGTRCISYFDLTHPDMQPMGDVEGVWYLLASGNKEINVILKCNTSEGEFEISTEEVVSALGGDVFKGAESREQLLSLIRYNLDVLQINWNNIENKVLNS